MSNITIVGAGMMGSALAFPARENGHRVRLTGTHLDREIIAESKRTGKHPKFDRPFPQASSISISKSSPKRSKGPTWSSAA